jgi:hypothetical protein
MQHEIHDILDGEAQHAGKWDSTRYVIITAAPAERVRELSEVLRLFKAERAKGLHTNEEDVCVKYYTWKMDKAWSGKHTLHLYRALSSEEASILVQTRRSTAGSTPVCSGRSSQIVQLVSADAATRQCYTCCSAAVCMLKPSKRCGKQQETGGGTLRTCWETISFFGHESRVRCWLISQIMSAKALFIVVLGSDQGCLIRSPSIA